MSPDRVDVAYVLISDSDGENVLLVRNEDSWSLPGGRREPGETLAEAAEREAKEEAGVVAKAGRIVDVSERITDDLHDVFTVFSAELLSGEPTASEHDDDVTEVAWVPVDQASQRMPWYPDGVEALLRAGGASHSAARG
ncbi:NUDIX domain-containing protein [Kitasatospora purpeofusca]|uniref:NUDIX domain-containing protein n=1 Tax=Kitasatospora purpeofusca TaxID=67352 RepID=UPI002E11C16B|nr:NUDIX domain-containing protein [Kitasatospora purpeofusca]WSR43318.1 NUDIX domain-containing protein [Kitasatospora purpeofusca]